VAALRAAEVAADQATAGNWRVGRCTQRSVAVLDDWVRKLAFHGDTLVAGTYGGAVHVIHIPTGAVSRTLRGLSAEVTALDFDGVSVAAGAADGGVCRWDAGSGAGGEVGRHEDTVVTAVQLEGAAGVVAATYAGEVHVHGCAAAGALSAGAPVCSLQRAGRYTAAGLASGRVVVWAGDAAAPLASATQILSFVAHTAPVLCMQLLRADATSPRDAAEDEVASRLADDDVGAASPPLSTLATGGADGVVRTWDLAAGGAPLRRLAAHRAPVTCLQADACKLVSGGRDGTLRVWDLTSGEQRYSISGHTAYLDALQFDGTRLIASGTNNLIALHDFSGRGGADDP
jgi:WD40 repeat protein